MIPNQDTMATSVESSRAPQNAGLSKLLVGLAVGLGIAGFFYFDLGHYLSLDGLKSNRDHLLAFTEANYTAAVAIFVVAYCTVVGLSLPGGAIMTLAGGFLFGSVLGTLYVNVGATVGATLAFSVARYLFEGLGGAEIREPAGSHSRGLCQERVQLSADSASDSAVSIFSGQYGVGTDESEGRNLCGGNIVRHHSR